MTGEGVVSPRVDEAVVLVISSHTSMTVVDVGPK